MPSKVYTKDMKVLLTPEQRKRIEWACLEKGYKLKRQMTPSEFCRIVIMKYVKEMEEKQNVKV